MKLWRKILIALFVIPILFFIAVFIFVNTRGKELFTQKLEDALNKEISIGSLELKIPLVLKITDLKIEELAEVSYIYAYPSLFSLLRGEIIFNEVKVLKPRIYWKRWASIGTQIKNNLTKTKKAPGDTEKISNLPTKENKQSFMRRPIIIKYLSVEDGIINFMDRSVSDSGIQIILRDVSADVDNLCFFLKSTVTNFQLTAKIPWQEDSGEGTIYASGWINLYKKDILTRLEIVDIDAVYLYPYYSKWVDLENSRIREASLNFFSDIQGKNNDILARCWLELTDIKFRPRPPDQPEHKAEKITAAVLGIFRALNQGRVILDFSIRTKMDKPEFKFASINQAVDKTLSGAIKSGRVKIEDVAGLPGRFFERMTEGTTGATRAVIDGAVSVGKSLKDAFLDAYKSEEESGGIITEQEKLFRD